MTDDMKTQKTHDVYIIAEIGGNHEGDFGLAKELLNQAVDSGVNAVKFQAYTGEGIANKVVDPSRVKHFNKFTLSLENHIELAEMCINSKVDYLASVWNKDMLQGLIPYMKHVKVGSGDLTNYRFFELISAYKKPLIISTGLSSEQEVIDAVKAIDRYYRDCEMGEQKHALLQCTSMYPIEYSDANLNVMHRFKELFPNYQIGYSDHTIGTTAIQVAISMGAKVIEAHFTDKKIKSDFRDHKVSKTIDEFKEIIKFSKQVKQLQGSNKKSLLEIEKAHGHEVSFRRSLYLNKKLPAGAVIGEQDVIALRPAAGIPASEFYSLLGKKLVRTKEALEIIEWHDFEGS